MKQKLIERWETLEADRWIADSAHIYPIMVKLDRIALILRKRYDFIVSF